jgi:hypothetical protein
MLKFTALFLLFLNFNYSLAGSSKYMEEYAKSYQKYTTERDALERNGKKITPEQEKQLYNDSFKNSQEAYKKETQVVNKKITDAIKTSMKEVKDFKPASASTKLNSNLSETKQETKQVNKKDENIKRMFSEEDKKVVETVEKEKSSKKDEKPKYSSKGEGEVLPGSASTVDLYDSTKNEDKTNFFLPDQNK